MSDNNNNEFENYIPETYVPKQHSHGTKLIWKVFWILTFLTVIDIVIYFMPVSTISQGIKNATFIILGVVKAYYIVGNFMHLKDEVKGLINTVVMPMFFIIYLVILLLIEADYFSTFN